MSDELEILTAQFDADLTRFNRKLDQLLGGFNSTSSRIEARNAQLVSKLNSQFQQISLTKLLAAAGVTTLIDKLVEGSKELADATLNTAKATGFSAETIQGLGIIAKKAGVDQDSFTTSLKYFSAQVGEAQLKSTDFGKVMEHFKISLKDPEAALFEFSDLLAKLPKSQADALAKLATGKSGASNVTWLTEGSANLKAMIADFQKMGLVVPKEQLADVQKIFEALDLIGKAALTGFIEGFSKFAGDVESPEFQIAVTNFGKAMGEISGFIVEMAPHIPTMIELFVAWQGLKTGTAIGTSLGALVGPEGALAGGSAGALIGGMAGYFGSKALINKMTEGQAVALPGGGTGSPGGSADASGILNPDETAKTRAYISRLNDQLTQQLLQAQRQVRTSASDMLKAHDDALLEMSRGTAAYYDVQKKAIEDEAAASIQQAGFELDAEIDSINARAQAQQDAARAAIKDKKQLAAELKQISLTAGQEEGAAAEVTSNKIVTINEKKNTALIQNDWEYQQRLQNMITLTDTLRNGLIDVGAAGVHGFKSMRQAAGDLLQQVADLIAKLYVMQPLVNGLLGAPGTTGGGLLGSFLTNIFGGLLGDGISPVTVTPGISFPTFAGGGVFVPGQGARQLKRFAGGGMSSEAAIFGEAGPEAAIPLPDGRNVPVKLSMPKPMQGAGSVTVLQQFDLSGAVVTDELYAQVRQQAANEAQKAVVIYDRKMLPNRVKKLTGDPRRMY